MSWVSCGDELGELKTGLGRVSQRGKLRAKKGTKALGSIPSTAQSKYRGTEL